jgi:hypothetical protein
MIKLTTPPRLPEWPLNPARPFSASVSLDILPYRHAWRLQSIDFSAAKVPIQNLREVGTDPQI